MEMEKRDTYENADEEYGALLLSLDGVVLRLEAMKRLGHLAAKVTPTSWEKILLRELIVVREMIRLSDVNHDAKCHCDFCQTRNMLLDIIMIKHHTDDGGKVEVFLRR